ncbi:MAG: Formiminotetrahydrofolate cyclodeaminase [uncultured Corynebacteriales bacterium]|uniref:Formiminotetrahydrofolate cyclodeaminase n=1 Tax=uncultured Mycobacteriales bacterium TaxID=581187 RepID=A0A6J4HAW8_9ACTN|nr:MAG: Formiminotetrahydrofolate cyclodeaminase [uncultured Corynebacteriales bacterium]
MRVKGQTVDQWLDELGSSAPAPGGGAAGALSAAMAAGLVEMVGNLSVGKGQDDAALRETVERAASLRRRAAELADEDAEVFTAVLAAYKLPRADEAEKAARRSAIDLALVGAARVPLEVATVAAEVVRLCTGIAPLSNPNVLSDVAVSAAAARAAVDSSVVNVEVNLALIKDATARTELTTALRPYASGDVQGEAERVLGEVRRRITA